MEIATVRTAFATTHPTRIEPSDNDLVPEDYQNRLMYWRETFKLGKFDIGDIARELIDHAARSGFGVTESRVYAAVAHYCGVAARTIRYYTETAVFYPPVVRQEYDVLPFSHFVFAKTMGERWQEVLDFSMAHPAMSEDGLRLHFLNEGLIPSPSPSEEAVLPPPAQEVSGCEISPLAPAYIRRLYLSRFSQVIETVDSALRDLPLSTKTQKRLQISLKIFRDTVPELLALFPEA